jgi:iron complex outermembrane receptor protein
LFRTDYFNNGLAEFPNGNPANDPEQAPPTHKNFLKFSPSVGVQYLATDWLTVHGNYAITYQNPTDSAFGANRPTTGVDISLLKATKSANGEGGFLVTKCPLAILGTCSLEATYFHDELTDVNVVTQTAQISLPASIALASAIYNGVSINFDNTPTKYFQIHGNAIIQHDYFTSYVPSGTTLNYKSYPTRTRRTTPPTWASRRRSRPRITRSTSRRGCGGSMLRSDTRSPM